MTAATTTDAGHSEADDLRRERGPQRAHHPIPWSSGPISWDRPPSPEFGPGRAARRRGRAPRRGRGGRRGGGRRGEVDRRGGRLPGDVFEPSPGNGPVWSAHGSGSGPSDLVQDQVERPARPDDAEGVGERRRVDEDVAPWHRRGAAVGDGLEALERAAEIADALGQVLLVLADDGEVGVQALEQRVEGRRVLAHQAVGLAGHGVDVGDQVGQVLVVGGQAGRDRVEVVDDREQLLVPAGQRGRQRVRRVDQLRRPGRSADRPSSSARRAPR